MLDLCKKVLNKLLQTLQRFDPIVYISIDTSSFYEDDIKALRKGLNEKIGQYILLKFSQHLSEGQFEAMSNLTDGNEIIRRLQQSIPNMEDKLQEELENFKREYHI